MNGRSPRAALLVGSVAGLLGTGAIAIGCAVAATRFVGRAGETYSPLDHFISELGEVAISAGAAWFNGGLVVGGSCFALMMIGLWTLDRHALLRLASAVGVVSGLAAASVGLLPMDDLGPHLAAAFGFFFTGLAAVGLFCAYVAIGRRLPRALALAGAPAFLAFAVFLVLTFAAPPQMEQILDPSLRPRPWAVPIAEWAVLVTTLSWIVAVAGVVLVRSTAPAAQGEGGEGQA
jgi:hypothetical membrane protein